MSKFIFQFVIHLDWVSFEKKKPLKSLIFTALVLFGCHYFSFGQDVRLSVQTGHSAKINQIVYNSDETLLASASADNNIAIWHLLSGKQFVSLNGHTASVTGIAFHPTNNTVYSSSLDSTIRIWDIQTGELKEIIPFDFPIGCISLNASGTHVAIGSKTLGWFRHG